MYWEFDYTITWTLRSCNGDNGQTLFMMGITNNVTRAYTERNVSAWNIGDARRYARNIAVREQL